MTALIVIVGVILAYCWLFFSAFFLNEQRQRVAFTGNWKALISVFILGFFVISAIYSLSLKFEFFPTGMIAAPFIGAFIAHKIYYLLVNRIDDPDT